MSDYKPKRRVSRVIPFGWAVDEHDDKLLQPVSKELDALEEAMKYLRSSSYREVCRWLVATTERYISHKSLFYIHKQWLKDKYGRKSRSTSEAQEG